MSYELKRCKRCLYPETTRPFLTFDEEGICSGCRTAEEKEKIDWTAREKELKALVEPYKNIRPYNCLIGVSGGKDSHYQVWYAKKILGLRPLAVTFNHLDNSYVGLRNLENLVTKLEVDLVRFTPNPEVAKKAARWGLKKLGQPFWYEHAGIYSFPVRVAVMYKIPLLLWGEYGYLDLIGMFGLEEKIEMGKRLRVDFGMRGYEVDTFLEGNDEGLFPEDLNFGVYPSNEDITKIGIKGIYLGNYIKWDQCTQTRFIIEELDFNTAEKERTFNTYENVECYFNDSVHDYLKSTKFGYNRAVDHASNLIRLGHINRDEGIYLINNYMKPQPDEKFYEYCRWLDMTPNEVLELSFKYDKEYQLLSEDIRKSYWKKLDYDYKKIRYSVINKLFESNPMYYTDPRFKRQIM